MAQHFLLSKGARTLSLASVFTMKDADAEMSFRRIRWAETDGAPICPHCKSLNAYDCRRLKGAPRFRCRECVKDFSITSGSLFASHKLPLRCYLAAIAIFVNEVKGKSALALSRDLNVSYKCAFVLLHKLRESLAADLQKETVGGAGKSVEIDGAYFGGYVKPANYKANRRDRRFSMNQSGKREVVVAMRERDGDVVPMVFKSEHASLKAIESRVELGTTVYADDAASWNELHGRYLTKRIDHSVCYSDGEACTNQVESFFSRIRRAEIGTHHHIAGPYLEAYAAEMAWREDARRSSNGEQYLTMAASALRHPVSRQWKGYWNRRTA